MLKNSLVLMMVVLVGGLSAQTVPALSERPRVALVLSGGGAMGLSHIGVIDVLESMGIPVDIVVGTSIGAMVGSAYAIGYSPKDMEDFVGGVDWSREFSEATPVPLLSYQARKDSSQFVIDLPFDFDGIKVRNGLLVGQNITSLMDRMTFKTPASSDFDTFPRRFRAVAADIGSGQEMVFARGSLSDAVRASMNLPAIFSPYAVEGHYYVDGGVVDQLPVEVARKMGADIVIAVNFDVPPVTDSSKITKNPFTSVQRSMDILINANVLRQIGEADVVIAPDMTGLSSTDFGRWRDMIQRGRDAGEKAAPQLRQVLERTGAVPANPRGPGVYFTEKPNPLLVKIRIEGGTPQQQSEARLLFAPFEGKAPEAGELQAQVDKLLQTGSFDFVKVRNLPIDGRTSELELQLIPRSTGMHSLLLGFSYSATYSSSIYSQLDALNEVALRDLTGPGSEWRFGGGFLDSPTVSTSYRQPLGLGFFTEGTFDLLRTSEVFDSYRLSNIAFDRMTTTGALGINPFPGTQLLGRFDYERFNFANFGDPSLDGPSRPVTSLVVQADLDRTDSPLFPMTGWALTGTYRNSAPGTAAFAVLSTAGEVGLSLDSPFSVFLLGRFGTDFSSGSGASPVPLVYMPTLADRRLFPALINTLDAVGNQVGALGLEIKFRVDLGVLGLPFPLFPLVQVGSGFVRNTDLTSVPSWSDLLWTYAGGLGLRFSPAFGFTVRVGEFLSPTQQTPFCAIDIGSFRP